MSYWKEGLEGARNLKIALRNGAYAWPGGYPTYFVAADGEAISFAAVKANFKLCLHDTLYPEFGNDWRIVAHEVNWEDADLYCAHTGKRIESAYAEPECD